MRLARSFSIAIGLAFASCARESGDDPFTLHRNLAIAARVEIVVESGAAEERARSLLERARAETPFAYSIVHPGDASTDLGAARIVIAGDKTPGADELCRALAAAADRADVTKGLGRDFATRLAADPTLAWLATFEDPARPGLPVTFAFAATALDALRVLGDLAPTSRPSWRAFEKGEIAYEGDLWREKKSSPPPVIDLATARALEKTTEHAAERTGFTFLVGAGVAPERVRTYGNRCDRAMQRLFETLLETGEKPSGPLQVHLRPAVDVHIPFAGGDGLAVRNPITHEVHALLSPLVPDDGGAELVRAYAESALGDSHAAWLADGLGCEAASSYWGQELGFWIAFVADAELVPPIAELVSDRCELSPHALVPLRAALVRFLVASRGKSAIRALWTGVGALAFDEKTESDFHRWLTVVEKARAAEIGAKRARRTAAIQKRGFRAGATITAPPGDPRVLATEFGGASFVASLAKLCAHGANAVSLAFDCWSELPSPRRPGDRAHFQSRASSSDLELFAATAYARQAGLAVTLRPELWLSTSSNYAGWMLLSDRPHWTRFFDEVRRTAVHYGLLGELAGVEILSLGGQIAGASVTIPSDKNQWEHDELPWRREQWSKTIATARRSFTGALTFAAQSSYEVRGIEFWRELDFVGVELYPETVRDGQGEQYSRERVVNSLVGLIDDYCEIASRESKPLLLLEVGYSSTKSAWKFADLPSGDIDGDMQAHLLEAFGDALSRSVHRDSPLAGFYLWFWSSDPQWGGEEDDGFAVQNKPAEKVLDSLFHRP